MQYSIETAAGFAHASGDRRAAEKRADGLAGTSIEESRTSSTLVNGIPQRMKPIARAYKDGKGIWQWAERLPEEDTVPELDKIAGSR